jgi:hypothetical protein
MPTPEEVLRQEQYARVRELLDGVSDLALRELTLCVADVLGTHATHG